MARRGCALSLLILVLVIAAVILARGLWLAGLGHWLEAPSNPSSANAIVVLGGDQERIGTAVSLYKQGLAPEIWYTGNYTPAGQILLIETQLAYQAAIASGVPAGAIHLLPTTSTWEDGQQIAAYAKERGTRSIVLVTSWYHAHRGLCIVRRDFAGSGVAVSFQAAANSTFGPNNWWRNEEGLIDVFDEYIKIGYYWLNYGLAPWQC